MEELIKRIIFSGAVVNFVLVVIGSAIGMLLKGGLPERIRDTLVKGMSLCVIYIGITGLFEDGTKPLVVLISMALGSILGELLDLDAKLNRLGQALERKFKAKDGQSRITEGFVSATMLFCVGAMTVVGSIDSGVSADNTTLYSKSVLDLVSSVALASGLGFGVMLSSVAVLVIEGGLTVIAALCGPMLNTDVITQMSVVGSMLIIALGLNMMGLTRLKVMNYLPAIFLPLLLCLIF